MKKLGELLTSRGWVSRNDLMRALNHQRRMGGRLGTCLLEMGLVTEEHLTRALAEQHRAEAVTVDDLRQVPEDLRQLVPKKIAVRCLAVPVHATTSKLTVALMDPANLACQDELSFATSRRLIIGVASEVRIREALERYYDEPADSRFTQILDRLNRRRYLWGEGEEQGGSATPAPTAGATNERIGSGRPLFPEAPDLSPPPLPRPDFDKPPSASGGEAVPAAPETGSPSGTAAETDSPSAAPARPQRPDKVTLSETERAALFGGRAPAPLSYEEAEQRLAEIESRDLAGRLVLDFLRQEFDRVILFAVRKDATTGWMGDGDGLEDVRLERLRIPFDKPSLFLNLRQGSAFHLGPLPSMPAHRPLVEVLGGQVPNECLVLPVRIGERMVAAIWCDRGGEHLGGADLEALRHLADTLAETLQRCILLKRQGQP